PDASMRRLSAISSLIDAAVLNGMAWRVNWSRIRSECSLVDTAAFHDHAQIVLILEHTEVLERIAGDDDEIGILARLHAADSILHAKDLGVHAGGRQQDFHRLHHLGLQLQLDRALARHVAEQIRARADLAAGAIRIGQALHALLAREVDLLD